MTPAAQPNDDFKATADELADPILRRTFRNYRRWDEGLWRVLELSTVRAVVGKHLDGPILDIGCGDGQIFDLLFGKRSDATGVDVSESEVKKANASGIYRNALVADARKLEFDASSFQSVFSNSVLEHIDGVDAVLQEAFRVLSPAGRFVFTTPSTHIRDADTYYWRKWLSPLGLDRIGSRIARREDRIYHHVSIRSPEAWEQALRTVGFVRVSITECIPTQAALLISKLSGAARIDGLPAFLARATRDPLFRNYQADMREDDWVSYYQSRLSPYFKSCEPGERGCGLLVIAEK